MSRVRVAAIIPARMASARFPGKPLLDVEGLPMIEHVRRRALLCKRFSEVVVVTCDQKIAAVVNRYGGTCRMTSPEHPGATDRVAEAVRLVDCTHVVNVQGDEILMLPGDLEKMVLAIEAEPSVTAWNAVARIEHADELADRAVVKCAISSSGRILYCSRDFSGLTETVAKGFEPLRKVVGILGYSREFLERYATMTRTPLEVAEGVDQSRIIEHDVTLRSVEFENNYPEINEPREVELVQRCLDEDPVQRALLQDILGAIKKIGG